MYQRYILFFIEENKGDFISVICILSFTAIRATDLWFSVYPDKYVQFTIWYCLISYIPLHIFRCCYNTYFPAAAAEHGCCAAAAVSRRRELRLMTDVAESCAPFPLQLHHAHLQLHLLPLPLSLTDTDSTTVLDAHVFSPLHEFGASCPLPEITKIAWEHIHICIKCDRINYKLLKSAQRMKNWTLFTNKKIS